MARTLLITGGAGFIGANAAEYFAGQDWQVVIYDNLSRRGTENNLSWLQSVASVEFVKGDTRDRQAVEQTFEAHRPDAVIHLAGQVAVTSSVENPREDFEINALGTFNLLEATRLFTPNSPFIYASTNKVYGKMENVKVTERNGRYEYLDQTSGITEDCPLDFYSPYGCSKGTGDQYVIDYHRIYGMPTTSFRQSCIYGSRQFGVEDQGWIAWFTIATLLKRPITIYGDGKQIRDILHVQDLIRAYEMAIENRDKIAGKAFNIGGGPSNTLSLIELVASLEKLLGEKIPLSYGDWRPGDQKVFVCNVDRAVKEFGWTPKVDVQQGISLLYQWIEANTELIQQVLT